MHMHVFKLEEEAIPLSIHIFLMALWFGAKL